MKNVLIKHGGPSRYETQTEEGQRRTKKRISDSKESTLWNVKRKNTTQIKGKGA